MPGSPLMVHGQRPMTGSGILPVRSKRPLQHLPHAGKQGSGAGYGLRSQQRTAGNLRHWSISRSPLAPPASACTGLCRQGGEAIPMPGCNWTARGDRSPRPPLPESKRDRSRTPWSSSRSMPRRTASTCSRPWNGTGQRILLTPATLLESLHGGCSAGTRVANIDAQGNVYPCQFARSPEFLVGNVRDRPFGELWSDGTNPVLSRFRRKNKQVRGTVRDCTWRDLCGGGCRVRAHAA